MVHSATDNSRKRKRTYLISAAIILALAIYADIVTGDSDDSSQSSLPIFAFSTPTLLVLVLVGIFTIGTRDKWESEENASAYSVFNEGGRAILGGMSAKELDGQLRGGPVGGYGGDVDDERTSPRGRMPRDGVMKKRPVRQVQTIDGRQERLREERAEAALKRMNR